MGIKGTLETCPHPGMFGTVFVPDGSHVKWIMEHRFENDTNTGPLKCVGYKLIEDRQIFYVDTGDMSPEESVKVINKMMKGWQTELIPNK